MTTLAKSQDAAVLVLAEALYKAGSEGRSWDCFLRELCAMTHASGAHLVVELTPTERGRYRHVAVSCGDSAELHALIDYVTTVERPNATGCQDASSSVRALGRGWREDQGAACVVMIDDDPTCCSLLSVHWRDRDSPPAEYLLLLQDLHMHLVTALNVRRQLMRSESTYRSMVRMLDHLPYGVLVVGPRHQVVEINSEAEKILALGDVPVIIDREGTLSCVVHADQRLLDTLLKGALQTRGNTADPRGGFLRLAGPPPLELLVVAQAHRDAWILTEPRAVIFLADPHPEQAPPEHLSALRGLAPTEAEVASLLMSGMRVKAIGEELGIATGTVRSHVHRLLQKTGSQRQQDMISRLLRGAARLKP